MLITDFWKITESSLFLNAVMVVTRTLYIYFFWSTLGHVDMTYLRWLTYTSEISWQTQPKLFTFSKLKKNHSLSHATALSIEKLFCLLALIKHFYLF